MTFHEDEVENIYKIRIYIKCTVCKMKGPLVALLLCFNRDEDLFLRMKVLWVNNCSTVCTWRFPVLLFLMRMVSWSSLYVDASDIGLLSTCFSAVLSSSLLICCWNTNDKPHYWWSFRTCSIFNLLVNLLLDCIILKTKTNYLSKQEMSKHSQL